ncbi:MULTISPECIES: YhdH/YhfP family quinone oxidoreductase [Rhodanobacter]|uniref:YhdH/YhfP family quinone oxidoreductase n=1 Tax=Rhodanobacter TaxID=75309 RepID=UPI0004026DD6|nr:MULTISPECIES: YhdH/YhfP family quinone oxidoreductase [Rhodanobacter]KZC21616.1 quinone oxidoreductase [Rhodanobacter denitrificans]UJJ52516.1 YhdH/YhfP family quinone oxidoreductase [Rhodanobacter denitrificans]UJM95270.1 YhdH/YhfP family quinone oxidoreductase [Rhodanobacter denitrificans]UJM98801.1 YhdH/YhfP family quinone oxidoreductase [Rhodanobacter denitrificans]UJN21784.1 YhdH/YhfP family quinone oxidoreductase [Rhodanobacter denitrificans]
MTSFRAFRIHHDDAGYRAGVETMDAAALLPGEVLVKVAYSSVNYKDALAGTGKSRILRTYPLNGGIDVAGHVVASTDPTFREGDAVLCTGSGLSETRDGGYGEYARLDVRWTIPLPPGLSLRESMILGTAGFTAALALLHMQDNRQTPALGPIAVTGASGGVGQLAIDIFSRAGYEVHAISGKADHFDFLRSLGATDCIDRHQLAFSGKPMDSARFGGALDNVGGGMLGGLLPLIAPYGNVAICGNAGGIAFDSTVMPFIIRGVSLLGIASAGTARELRDRVWQLLAGDWKPRQLERIVTREAGLDELPGVFARMLAGDSFGRTLVRIEGTL